MKFMLDENVPAGVADMLAVAGHSTASILDFVPRGSPDPLVATVSEENDFVLISHDGDFEKISPRIPFGQKARFRRLSRIWLRCPEPSAAARLESFLDLVVSEFALAQRRDDKRLHVQISLSFIRIQR